MVSQIVETNRRISELNVQLSAVGAAVENSDSNAAEGTALLRAFVISLKLVAKDATSNPETVV